MGAWSWAKSEVKHLRLRIFLSRFIACYFFLALAHFVGQLILVSITLADDTVVVNTVSGILDDHGIRPGLPLIEGGTLRDCDGAAHLDGTSCTVLAQPPDGGNGPDALFVADYWNSVLILYNQTDDASDVTFDDSPQVTDQCAMSMGWILDVFHDAKREELATLFFQLWLLVMSMMAVLADSTPHLIAALSGHFMNTAWASFNVYTGVKMKHEYQRFIVAGACNGVDVLGGWWDERLRHSAPILVLNTVATLAMVYLTWKLSTIYHRQSFSSVGAPSNIIRIHRVYLGFVMTLQLASFFTIAATALWISKLTEDAVRRAAENYSLYLAGFIVTVLLNIVWVTSGWLCIRRENRALFWPFLLAGLVVITIWTIMFFSPLYRFVFLTWPFFANMTIVSYVFLVATSVLGIACRFNFGQGLAHYLMVLKSLANDDFTPASFANDPEKVEWPVKFTDIPRFSVMTGEGYTVTPIGPGATVQHLVSLPKADHRRESSVVLDICNDKRDSI